MVEVQFKALGLGFRFRAAAGRRSFRLHARCEENKRSFEQRLAELSLVMGPDADLGLTGVLWACLSPDSSISLPA